MTDQTIETLPWVEAQDLGEKITPDLLSRGVGWLKGDFRENWKSTLQKRDRLEKGKNGGREEMLNICTNLANLQRDLAHYLFLVSRSRDVLKELQGQVADALFGVGSHSVVNCLGSERRGCVEGSLVGVISNLTFWHLIAESNSDLSKRLNFGQMVVGGLADAKFAIDAILDFGTRNKDGKKVLRVVQLKGDRWGQIIVDPIYPDDLKTSYLGGSVSKNDAQRMIDGARQLYPDCHFLFFAVCVPAFDSPPVRNVFGIIHPDYPDRDVLIDSFKDQALAACLLPDIKK